MKYRYLGDSGLSVSRVCLGTMTFGMPDWGCDQETSSRITNRFIDAGGNFIDTADMYSNGVSEKMLGQAIREHRREDLVVATKCFFRTNKTANAKGLSRKHVIEACEASLRRLGTDFIDLYQIHGPDPFTPVEETMKSLDDLIRKGAVRYIGCSNLFAWQIVKANGISERCGLYRFCSGQYLYNLIKRDIEREILPACRDQGMGIICWSPLAGGFLTGKYPRSDAPESGSRIAHRANVDIPRYWHDHGFNITDAVADVAKEIGKTTSQVSLGWLLADPTVASVIVGVRNADQIEDNVAVGDWDLDPEIRGKLSEAAEFDHGYPMDWVRVTYPSTFGNSEFLPKSGGAHSV